MSNRLTELTIREEKDERSSSYLCAKIGEGGSLVLEGVDAGEEINRIFGDWDLEYWLTIKAEDKDTILLHLIKSQFSSVHAFKDWLAAHGIDAGFSCY